MLQNAHMEAIYRLFYECSDNNNEDSVEGNLYMKKITAGPESRYAKALFELALETEFKPVSRACSEIQKMLNQSDDLMTVLTDDTLAIAKKKNILSGVAKAVDAPKFVENFLFLLADKKRMAILPRVLETYFSMLDEHNGVVHALVTTAATLTEEQRADVISFVKAKQPQSKEVMLQEKVDASLIAGARVRISNTRYDCSVRGKLDGLRAALIG